MKRLLASVLLMSLLFSCQKEKKNLQISGNVKGLKKGTLYLQKVEESNYLSIDSLQINGDPHFSFSLHLDSPEILYLYLVKDDGIDFNDRLEFFAEEGNMTINTTIEYFLAEAKVEGSKTHEKLVEYRKMMSKFAEKNLDLLKANLEYQQKGNSVKVDSIEKVSQKNATRGFLYTLNFALNNKDSYVAPYIALSEAYNARLKYLDTINNSLTPEVADSKYGKELKKFIENIREQEKDSVQ